MPIQVSPNLPANVVEIGNEITQAKVDEINAGTVATQSWVSSNTVTLAYLSANYQPLSGMSSYLTTSAASSTYQTQAGMSSYLTTSSASTTYAPKASPTFTGTVTIPAGASISGYLTSATAASTYQTISGMSSYLTTSSASTTYAPKASPTFTGTVTIPAGASISGYLTTSSASSTYQTISGMSSYLTTASASSTYQTQSGMSSYLTSATAASTYQTIAGMSSYLTTSSAASTYQPIGSYLTDAPSNGNEYVRKNGAWSVATGGGGGSVAWGSITGTLTSQTDLTTYISGLGYQTAIDVSTYVGAQGFLTDAPSNGNEYVRLNGAWSIATGGGGGLTISTLSNAATSTLNATAPTTGQALTFDGTDLVWATVSGGGGGGVAWGGITGTVTDQTDLVSYISGLNYYSATNPNGYISAVPTKTVYVNAGTLSSSHNNNIIYLDSTGTMSGLTINLASGLPVGFEVTIVANLAVPTDTISNFMTSATINGGSSVNITNNVSKLVQVDTDVWFYT